MPSEFLAGARRGGIPTTEPGITSPPLRAGGGTEERVFKVTGLAFRAAVAFLDRPTRPTDHGGPLTPDLLEAAVPDRIPRIVTGNGDIAQLPQISGIIMTVIENFIKALLTAFAGFDAVKTFAQRLGETGLDSLKSQHTDHGKIARNANNGYKTGGYGDGQSVEQPSEAPAI